jgi:Cu/Ag efflux protein CusF
MKYFKMRYGLQTMVILLTALFIPLFEASAEEEPQPAIGAEVAAMAVATVVGIDKETRTLTLREEDGDGEEWSFVAGPEVRNFDQIVRGDLVIAQYYSSFAVALGPKDSGLKGRVDRVEIEKASEGEKPGAKVTHTVAAVGTVEAVDQKTRMVTVKGPRQTVVLDVSEYVDLTKVKIGDEVEAVYIRSYAISVEPAPEVSGTVEIMSTSVALGIGVEWGHGTLTMNNGSTYTFDLTGMSVLDLGISTVEAVGKVYKLVESKDLEGTYFSGAAGATFGYGGSGVAMKNGNGLVLKLRSKQKGLKLTLAPGGMSIKNVQPTP